MQAILERLRAEFLEMPGLRLTADQVHRLCGVERMTCRAVLDALVDEKFLCAKADGTYARITDGDDVWHHRPAS
jgi:response regulator of citrate/malate metabolism